MTCIDTVKACSHLGELAEIIEYYRDEIPANCLESLIRVEFDLSTALGVPPEARRFPPAGPRCAVYDHLRRLGFAMDKHTDKVWRRDGITLGLFATGSMARVDHPALGPCFDCAVDELEDRLAALERLRES